MKLLSKLARLAQKLVDNGLGGGLAQEMNKPVGERYVTPGMGEAVRAAASEGIVLLENDGVLPLARGARVAVFGRCQFDYFYVGYGSGGDVHPPYTVSPAAGLAGGEKEGRLTCNAALRKVYEEWRARSANRSDDGWWGHWPMHYPEMPVSPALAAEAAAESDVAVVIIGRAAGEDRDNKPEPGSYYLTRTERDLLDAVTAAFAKTVVVLDCGNIIDLAWVKGCKGRISALVYAWHGGMESGNALLSVLTGEISPCGKLTDTIAEQYTDYPAARHFGGKKYNEYAEDIYVGYRYFETFAPERVLYPFGYGLSYTNFSFEAGELVEEEAALCLRFAVQNTGERAGKEVAQLYVSAPRGRLGKPARVLAGFVKTDVLAPGQRREFELRVPLYSIASFDEAAGEYVLEAGEYAFYIGSSVRAQVCAGRWHVGRERSFGRLAHICPVQKPFTRLCMGEGGAPAQETVPARRVDLRARIEGAMPAAVGFRGERGIALQDVAAGRAGEDDFISQLSDADLEALTRGYGCMNAPFGSHGNGGAFGGITPALQARGVPPVITADGPSGLRVSAFTALLPCGTALASAWNPALVQALYEKAAEEMAHFGVDVLLAPGMNIHRDPLCGRNFEYYAEDPLLSGKIAAGAVRGIQSRGGAACIKHFACNNQETNRNKNDSRVSERALREIYLKGFEICIAESAPAALMTSYNKINGVWSHYNYDLAATVLRGEWGYTGLIMTDWWMQHGQSPEFAGVKDNAYRIRARVDLYMPGSFSRVCKGYKADKKLIGRVDRRGGVTRGELEYCARNTLRAVIRLCFAGNKAEQAEPKSAFRRV